MRLCPTFLISVGARRTLADMRQDARAYGSGIKESRPTREGVDGIYRAALEDFRGAPGTPSRLTTTPGTVLNTQPSGVRSTMSAPLGEAMNDRPSQDQGVQPGPGVK